MIILMNHMATQSKINNGMKSNLIEYKHPRISFRHSLISTKEFRLPRICIPTPTHLTRISWNKWRAWSLNRTKRAQSQSPRPERKDNPKRWPSSRSRPCQPPKTIARTIEGKLAMSRPGACTSWTTSRPFTMICRCHVISFRTWFTKNRILDLTLKELQGKKVGIGTAHGGQFQEVALGEIVSRAPQVVNQKIKEKTA